MRKNILDKGLANGTINSIDPVTGMAIAGGVSGLLGGGGGGGSSSSTSMPAWLSEAYREEGGVMDSAKDIFLDGAPDYYSGDMVADLDPMQLQAINSIGGMEDTLNPAAGGYAEDVLAGDYLGGDQFMDAYGQDIMENVQSKFSMGGRGGSQYGVKTATSEMGDVASRLYGDERNRQNQILQGIPSLVESKYTPAQQQMMAGDVLQGQNQNEIGADVNAFNYEQNKDINNLSTYTDFLNSIDGGSTTTTSGPETNPLIAGIGGAMSGASIGSNWGK